MAWVLRCGLAAVLGACRWDVPAGAHEMTVHPVNAMRIPGSKTTVRVKAGT